MDKIYIKIAGIIKLMTALIHLFAGQIDLVNPLIRSNLEVQQISEWIGVWHIASILLFFTSYLILKAGFKEVDESNLLQLKAVAVLYILIGIPFVVSSVYFSVLAPQWILLMPIGISLIIGLRKLSKNGLK